jgi:hypothetical protein
MIWGFWFQGFRVSGWKNVKRPMSNIQCPALTCDRLDPDFGERLAVAVFLAVAFAALFVKYDDFVAFHVAKHAGANACALDVGCADSDIAVVLDEMHGVERDFVSFISCQPVDEDLLTFLNFELLTGNGNDCEHIENQKFGENKMPFSKKAGKGTSTRLKNQV